ncbi:MAG: lipase family protein [Gordonia sp. (in: high G+C Gram-positive bacteria)]
MLAILGILIVGAAAWAVAGPAGAEPAAGARGAVVTSTDITGDKMAKLAGAGKAIRITYLSEDANGDVVPARATVYIPAALPEQGALRTMVWGHGTRGIGTDCLVSDKLGNGGRFDAWLGPWLKEGYVLVSPDYAGIGVPGKHVYLDGGVSGRNMLDAVRAARTVAAQQTGRQVSNAFIATGGSQGGHAALWAGHLAKSYVPELKNVGVVATSAPVDLASYFSRIAPGVPPVAVPDYAVYFTYVMRGVQLAHPEVNVPSYLTPLGRKLLAESHTKCYPQLSAETANIPVGDLVSRPLNDGPFISALRQLTYVPTKGYSAPLLLQQGVLDPVTPTAVTDGWADQARANGVDVTVRDYQAGHGANLQAETFALQWAGERNWPND